MCILEMMFEYISVMYRYYVSFCNICISDMFALG